MAEAPPCWCAPTAAVVDVYGVPTGCRRSAPGSARRSCSATAGRSRTARLILWIFIADRWDADAVDGGSPAAGARDPARQAIDPQRRLFFSVGALGSVCWHLHLWLASSSWSATSARCCSRGGLPPPAAARAGAHQLGPLQHHAHRSGPLRLHAGQGLGRAGHPGQPVVGLPLLIPTTVLHFRSLIERVVSAPARRTRGQPRLPDRPRGRSRSRAHNRAAVRAVISPPPAGITSPTLPSPPPVPGGPPPVVAGLDLRYRYPPLRLEPLGAGPGSPARSWARDLRRGHRARGGADGRVRVGDRVAVESHIVCHRCRSACAATTSLRHTRIVGVDADAIRHPRGAPAENVWPSAPRWLRRSPPPWSLRQRRPRCSCGELEGATVAVFAAARSAAPGGGGQGTGTSVGCTAG